MDAPAPRLAAPASDAAPLAFLALVGGAVAMGISPIFVRFAEIGPFTSAFWRVGLGAAGALAVVAAGRPARHGSAPGRIGALVRRSSPGCSSPAT